MTVITHGHTESVNTCERASPSSNEHVRIICPSHSFHRETPPLKRLSAQRNELPNSDQQIPPSQDRAIKRLCTATPKNGNAVVQETDSQYNTAADSALGKADSALHKVECVAVRP
eukprot:GHVO01002329.1.p2 GENE.GHVO01002329.1~~GHVO01002329.1.p2  ORF type:complete len:115 (+),score=7.02 GHVO01002329.1:744-1088(+)